MIAYFKHLLDILFPPVCFACGAFLKDAKIQILCAPCRESIVQNTAFTCPVCRARLPAGRHGVPGGYLCHKDADYILLAASSYSNPALRALIWQLKFRGRVNVALELAKLLHGILHVVNLRTEEYICIPVPLHASRRRERGFNQAELIARELAKMVAVPILTDALVKVRKTKPQTKIKDRDERKKNLSGCFVVARPELVAGKNILLVDDVWTSGATMDEASRALKLAGAKKIIGLVVAKAG